MFVCQCSVGPLWAPKAHARGLEPTRRFLARFPLFPRANFWRVQRPRGACDLLTRSDEERKAPTWVVTPVAFQKKRLPSSKTCGRSGANKIPLLFVSCYETRIASVFNRVPVDDWFASKTRSCVGEFLLNDNGCLLVLCMFVCLWLCGVASCVFAVCCVVVVYSEVCCCGRVCLCRCVGLCGVGDHGGSVLMCVVCGVQACHSLCRVRKLCTCHMPIFFRRKSQNNVLIHPMVSLFQFCFAT